MSQECDLCSVHMPMIYLEFYILCLQGNRTNVIPLEANFHLVLEYSFKHFRKHLAISRHWLLSFKASTEATPLKSMKLHPSKGFGGLQPLTIIFLFLVQDTYFSLY